MVFVPGEAGETVVGEEYKCGVEVRKEPVSRETDLRWITLMWEPGGAVPSGNMVMVMRLLLCGISRSGSGRINRMCPNRNNKACVLPEEKESQYQMHHKQDDCEAWR